MKQPHTRKDTPFKAETTVTRLVRKVSLVLIATGLFTMLTTAFVPVAAAEIPGEEVAIVNPWGIAIFAFGVVGGIIYLVVRHEGYGDNTAGVAMMILIVLAIILPLAMGAVVLITEGTGPTPSYCEKNPTDPACKDFPQLSWNIELAADLDVDGAAIPGTDFTTIDASVGGTTGEWVAGDNGNVELDDMLITVDVHIDTDLADTAALWMEPNGIIIEISWIQLEDGPKSSDGSIATQQYYGRIDSISKTSLASDNASLTQKVFFEDSQGRWHIGWQIESGRWIEACSEYRGKDLPNGASCSPVVLGTDDGTGDTAGAIASAGTRLFWIWEDRGPFAYRDGNGATWTLTFSFGSESDWHTFTFIVTMDESATDNT